MSSDAAAEMKRARQKQRREERGGEGKQEKTGNIQD